MSVNPVWFVLAALIGALAGALVTLIGNWCLQTRAQKRNARARVIRNAERFCDELMTHATAYWSKSVIQDRSIFVGVLAEKVTIYEMQISRYIYHNFRGNKKIEGAMAKVNRDVTGGSFGKRDGQPDNDRFILSIHAIINLRLTIAEQEEN